MNAVAQRWFSAALALVFVACRDRAEVASSRPATSLRPGRDAGRDSYIRRARTSAPGCPAALATSALEGSLHADTVARDERWLAAESPHRLPYGLHVHPGATLTIEPCALLLVGPRMEFVVHGGASLRVAAAAGRPVRFARLDPAHAWQALELRADVRGDSTLDGVTIEGAGAAPTEPRVTAAALRLAMRGGLRARDLLVVGSEAWGVAVVGGGRFADRDATIAIRANRGEGVVTIEDVNRVADLPHLDLVDNANNDVRIEARVRTLTADARWRSLGDGARYRVRPAMHVIVEGAASPALTVEAGARIAFGEGAELDVGFGAPGALVVAGENLHPVVLEGAEEGRWVGLQLGPRFVVDRSHLAHLRLQHAGASSGVIIPTCGCPGGHVDEAMLTLQGFSAPDLLHDVSFVDGPSQGFGLIVAGVLPPGRAASRDGGGALDFTRSGVRCAIGAPMHPDGCGH